MHLCIDIRTACHPERTGKGQWTYALVDCLLQRPVALTLLTDAPLPATWAPTQRHTVIRFRSGPRWHLQVAALLKNRQTSCTCYLSPTSYIVPSLLGRQICHVPVIHDLIALLNEPHDRKAMFIERLLLKRTIMTAGRILTVSHATKDDLLHRFPVLQDSQIRVVHAGPSERGPAPTHPTREPIILNIATLCPRKNQARLISAYRSLTPDLRAKYRLILVGKRGWQDREIMRLIDTTAGVSWLGYLPGTACRDLLGSATVFAYPSLYEGFGLPILDAMQLGIPILTSDRSSLKEIAGTSALYINPLQTDSITTGLHTLLTNEQLQRDLQGSGRLQAGKYSWEKTTDSVLHALQTID